jgi:DNA modification methylase
VCPLQLDVIERALHWQTNPNDLVFSPFMGIGSEGWCSVREGRRFIGTELKDTYFAQSLLNLAEAEETVRRGSLLDIAS